MAVDVTVESSSAGRHNSLSFRLALTGQEGVVAAAVTVVVPLVVVRVGKSEWERIGEGEPGGKGIGGG